MARPYAGTVRASPEIVAHRGASDDEPEHSLAAYLLALEQGADAIECDVRLTADGTLVCVHDRRIDRTSTGKGAVSSQTFAELAQHDYSGGTWLDFEDPDPDETRTAVLSLRALLATMLDASDSVSFAIETKHPTRFGGYVEEALVEVLRYFGLTHGSGAERARVMSFSRSALRRVHDRSPGLATVLLMDRVPARFRDGTLPARVPIAGPSMRFVRKHPGYVARLHERGNRVHVWTVDDKDDVRLCLDLGVDAIITNRPGRVARLAGR
jgi:glycerophosphoryl diester phosphodiesterase